MAGPKGRSTSGWLLAATGYAATARDDKKIRRAYLVAFALIQIYTAPWGRLLAHER